MSVTVLHDGRAMKTGEKLQRFRRARGFTQKELATKADLSQSTIAQIERGSRYPHPHTLAALATALGVDAMELLDDPLNPSEDSDPR